MGRPRHPNRGRLRRCRSSIISLNNELAVIEQKMQDLEQLQDRLVVTIAKRVRKRGPFVIRFIRVVLHH